MAWWVWVLVGLGLFFLEVAAPGGFFAVFFGVAALLVGVLTGLGGAGPAWGQWLLFSVLSVLGLLVFRRPLMNKLKLGGRGRPVDSMVGETAMVLEEVPPGGVGKAEMRGASWNARSTASASLARGRRCLVERVDGLTLWIRPE
jgi:membrane protein implicated in regulation of membrane protease activity